MERLAIVGLGLIGGSLGLALKRALPELEVVGVARRSATADAAVKLGAADRAGTDVAAVSEADLVVLACPLAVTPEVMGAVAPHLTRGARVTDVGSVKQPVVAAADRALPNGSFLGGHPMAGKEVTGIEHAEADLFQGRAWVLTAARGAMPGPDWDDLCDAIRAIGARPVFMPPSKHDRYVAMVSHLPFLLSAAYLRAVGDGDDWEAASALASSGFRDISRLGAGDPGMYAAIAAANRDQVLGTWASLHAALDEFEAAIVRGDGEALLGLLSTAQQTRRRWADAHHEMA